MIKRSRSEERGLTVYVCSGVVTLEELTAVAGAFYASDPTPRALLDFSGADLSHLPADGMRRLAEFSKERAHARTGGRTAILAGDPVGFGLGRMYEAFADITGQQIEIRVFQDRADAERWLER